MATHKDLKRAYLDPARCKSAWRRWYDVNKKEVNERKRLRYRQIDAHVRQKAARVHSLKTLYGISQEDYVDMYDAQHGRCAICQKPETRLNNQRTGVRLLNVDHDHKTGRVRGLLCSKCNHGLGNAEDDVLILRAMIAYLESHNG